MATQIEIENTITVGDLADKLMLPVTKLITELFKNGVMATVNERIDFDTAQIMVGELGLEPQPVYSVFGKRLAGHVGQGRSKLGGELRKAFAHGGQSYLGVGYLCQIGHFHRPGHKLRQSRLFGGA